MPTDSILSVLCGVLRGGDPTIYASYKGLSHIKKQVKIKNRKNFGDFFIEFVFCTNIICVTFSIHSGRNFNLMPAPNEGFLKLSMAI